MLSAFLLILVGVLNLVFASNSLNNICQSYKGMSSLHLCIQKNKLIINIFSVLLERSEFNFSKPWTSWLSSDTKLWFLVSLEIDNLTLIDVHSQLRSRQLHTDKKKSSTDTYRRGTCCVANSDRPHSNRRNISFYRQTYRQTDRGTDQLPSTFQ